MSKFTPLPPPGGFATWLDFAVETFDTQGRDAIREAARAELTKLRHLSDHAPTDSLTAEKQRQDVDRVRNIILRFAVASGSLGFVVSMSALLLR